MNQKYMKMSLFEIKNELFHDFNCFKCTCICLELFGLVNAAWSEQMYLLIQTRTLYHWGRVIMDYELDGIWVKNILMLDLFQLLMLTDGLWCFYQTLILTAPIHIHCWDTFLQTWWRNTLILIWDGLRESTSSSNYHVWVSCRQSRSSLYAEYASCVGPPKHQGVPLFSKKISF